MELGPGARIGEYVILAPLRSGGMGDLFVAGAVGPGGFARHVAVKVVHDKLARDPEFIGLFLREARLSARIRHPNIVHVEALGQVQDAYYLVMELVEGVSLHELIRALRQQGRRIPIPLAVHIAAEVAHGLHAAHETADLDGKPLGIIHRDVSPDNVLLTLDGFVKVIDFGIAKAAHETAFTRRGFIRGKVAYMSPEQALGRPADRRTDVYSLGTVTWEMLVGKRLVRGENHAELFAFVREPRATAPSAEAPEVTPELDRVVLRALAPDPAHRFPTARDFRRALYEAVPPARDADSEDLAWLVGNALKEQVAQIRSRSAALGAATRAGGMPARPPASVPHPVATPASGATRGPSRMPAPPPAQTPGSVSVQQAVVIGVGPDTGPTFVDQLPNGHQGDTAPDQYGPPLVTPITGPIPQTRTPGSIPIAASPMPPSPSPLGEIPRFSGPPRGRVPTPTPMTPVVPTRSKRGVPGFVWVLVAVLVLLLGVCAFGIVAFVVQRARDAVDMPTLAPP